jgi:hypothetical protein
MRGKGGVNFRQQGFQLLILHGGYQLDVNHINDLLMKLDFRVDIGFVEFAATEILQLIETLLAIGFRLLLMALSFGVMLSLAARPVDSLIMRRVNACTFLFLAFFSASSLFSIKPDWQSP